MQIRDLIITLDRMCMNSRNLAKQQGMEEVYQEEAEAGELALNILHAFQIEGAATTEEVLALIRAYPEVANKCALLKDELVQAKKDIADLRVENRMQRLALDTFRALMDVPGVAGTVALAYAREPERSFSALLKVSEKLQDATSFLSSICSAKADEHRSDDIAIGTTEE